MPKEPGFRAAIISLWFRLMSLGIVGLVFAEALSLAIAKIQGWTFYLSTLEVIFEVLVRVVFAALAGMALGTLCTALLAPFVWHFSAQRERLVEWATRAAVVLVLVPDTRFALVSLIKWSNRGVRFTSALLIAHLLAFAIALCIPRARKAVVTSLDDFVGEKMSRRMALATVGGAAALVVTEFSLGRLTRTARAALAPVRPKSNFLLVTFDALAAEDMSLYGYRLPTTPNLDAFARKGTVFKNFYSACTFTTPSVATMLTGVYPSENKIHQLQGRVHPKDVATTLPHLMRSAGYATGAFVSNPFAYYFANSLENEYDHFPAPVLQKGGLQRLWDATAPLHQNSGIGSQVDEYHELEILWNSLARIPSNLSMRFRAGASFEHAREVLAELPQGFFLWVHVMTPHHPYLPDPADRGRFLPYEEQRRFEEDSELQWRPHYSPDQQSQVDRRRLLYDEFILTADRAFGTFITQLENSGKLQDTTVVVSADHGESFEGGVFRHESPYLTRPVIHIPLIIRTPGQQDGRTVLVTADQTALAPTILELAGQKQPDRMRGQSLAGWLNRDGQGEGQGLAFSQFLEKNSLFGPLQHGMVGVIDGRSKCQFVLDLDTQKGALRPLDQAHIWNVDRSADNPALAESLRAAIREKFSDLAQVPS